jgi:hypothetical protein
MGSACSSPGQAAHDMQQLRYDTRPAVVVKQRRSSSVRSFALHQSDSLNDRGSGSYMHPSGDSAASTFVGSSLSLERAPSAIVALRTVALRGAALRDPCPPAAPRRTIRASRAPHSSTARDAFDDDRDEGEDGRRSDATDDTYLAHPQHDDSTDRGEATHDESPSSNREQDSWGWSGEDRSRRRDGNDSPKGTTSGAFVPKASTTQSEGTEDMDDNEETPAGQESRHPPSVPRPQPPTTHRSSFSGSDARSLTFSRNESLRDVSLSISSTAATQQATPNASSCEGSTKGTGNSAKNNSSRNANTAVSAVSGERAASTDTGVLPPLVPVPSVTGSIRRSFRRTPLKKIDASAFKSVTFMSSDNSPTTPPIRSFGAVMQPSPRLGIHSIASGGLLPPMPPLASMSPKPAVPVPVAWRISPSSPRVMRSEPLVRVAQMAEFGAMFFSAQALNTDATNTTDENAESISREPVLTQTQEYCVEEILALSVGEDHPIDEDGIPPLPFNPVARRSSEAISPRVLPLATSTSIAAGDSDDAMMVMVHSLVAETTHPFLDGESSSAQ